MNNFPFELKLRIDWSEMDLFGHVNNLAILKYVQAARVNMLEQFELMQMQKEKKVGPILASISSQFKKPLFYPGEVLVGSKIEWIKNSSFCIRHVLFNEKNEVAAEVQDIIVFYDFNNNIKLRLPQEIRIKIETLKQED